MDKEKKVYEVFQSISQDYDKMNDLISFKQHRKWKEHLVAAIGKQKPARVLDVCCGTGDISLLLAQKKSPSRDFWLGFFRKHAGRSR